MMEKCQREDKDLVGLNQKLFLGLNPKSTSGGKSRYRGKKGWKAYDTGVDNVKKRLTAENVIRSRANKRLDFTTKAANPSVYPNFEIGEIAESESKKDGLLPKKSDSISRNIERDNVVYEHQVEEDESLPLVTVKKSGHGITGSDLPRQKYFITQIKNYLPLVKDENVRKKLRIFLKYLYDTSSANELAINEKGHVQRGFFDTQTKFSNYLNYYMLPEKEKLGVEKPLFYDVVIGDPLTAYLSSNKQLLEGDRPGEVNHMPVKIKTESDIREVNDRAENVENEIIPLRNIKDNDLRIEVSLPKMINLLTSFNIEMGATLSEDDYKNLIKITAFPIYAVNPSKGDIESKMDEYNKFGHMLEALMKSGRDK